MTLKEVAKQQFKGTKKDTRMIGIFTGPNESINPDYADEYLSTHGEKEVTDYKLYVKGNFNILVVKLKEGGN